MTNPDVDYADVYRIEGKKKLKARIKRSQNILTICAIAIIAGALLFRKMEIPVFTTTSLIMYFLLSIVIGCLAFLSDKRPFLTMTAALIICIGFWTAEIILEPTDNLFIAGLIQKIFIITLLASALNNSREAELLRKELQFS